MPLDVSVRDNSQGIRVVSETVPNTNLTPSATLRVVESVRSDSEVNDDVRILDIAPAELRQEEVRLTSLFEEQRLEAETRLALTVERVEIDQSAKNVRAFQRGTVPVTIFGSLTLDVTV